MGKFKNWFKGLSLAGKMTTVSIVALISFGAIGTAAQQGTPAPATTPAQQQKPAPATPKIEVKDISTTEAIPFTSSTIQDDTLDQGTTLTRTKGSNGVLTRVYKVTYTNGAETSRSGAVDTITTPAVNEVIVVGAKAPTSPATQGCLNGTYVNSIGNIVCSPYTSSTVPTGATARCSDGTYSFSQHHSGTCSHHGGVANWL